MKYVSIDIETCGLNPEKDSIIEFGAVLDDLSHPVPMNELPIFHCYFTPIDGQFHGNPFALSMHPMIFKRVATQEKGFQYCSPEALGFNFKDFLHRFGYQENSSGKTITVNVAGKNFAGFDLQFLANQTDFLNYVRPRHRVIDPSSLFWVDTDDCLPDTKTCLMRAQLNPVVMHTAVEDALNVVQLVRKAFLKG